MNRLTDHFFKADRPFFTHVDVATSIEGTDFSRHALIKRAIAAGEVLNIRRGLYCLAPPFQKKPVNIYSIAQHVYGPSYVSLESALSYHGWIPEAVHACTCACVGNARKFGTPLGIFSYTRVPQRTFYFDVERCGAGSGDVFLMASPAKALADHAYTHHVTWTGIGEAAASLRIDADDWASVRPRGLSELRDNYRSGRVRRFLTGWLEALQT